VASTRQAAMSRKCPCFVRVSAATTQAWNSKTILELTAPVAVRPLRRNARPCSSCGNDARGHGKCKRAMELFYCRWLRTALQALQGVPRDNNAISLWSNEHAAFDHVVSERKSWTISGGGRRQTASIRSRPAPSLSLPPCPHPGPLPRAGEGDDGDAVASPRPVAGKGGTRDSGRVRGGARALADFAVFRDGDAPWCPEMVVVPAGHFLMGSPPDEPQQAGGRPASDDRLRLLGG
jgi:hypothetical protein